MRILAPESFNNAGCQRGIICPEHTVVNSAVTAANLVLIKIVHAVQFFRLWVASHCVCFQRNWFVQEERISGYNFAIVQLAKFNSLY